jgi:hypothetical protein
MSCQVQVCVAAFAILAHTENSRHKTTACLNTISLENATESFQLLKTASEEQKI